MTAARDIWFHYTVQPGRLRGWPVNAKGWAALIALVVAPHPVLWALVNLLDIRGPWVAPLFLVVALPAVFIAIAFLVKAKGLRV